MISDLDFVNEASYHPCYQYINHVFILRLQFKKTINISKNKNLMENLFALTEFL